MNEFYKRSLYGTLFVIIVTGLVLWGAPGLILLCVGVSSVCIYEYLKLRGSAGFLQLTGSLILNFMVLAFSKYNAVLVYTGSAIVSFGQIIAILLILLFLLLRKFGEDIHDQIAAVIFSVIYISVPFLLLLNLQPYDAKTYDWQWPMLVFILVWTSDTCAYVAGKLLGKHPLSPSLSPGKTIEGFIGGTILSAGVGAVLSFYFNFITIIDGIFLGILVSASGTLGDLFQSSLKRKAGVKDSGKIIPGHGGLLDRFDAFLLAVCAVYMYFAFTLKI